MHYDGCLLCRFLAVVSACGCLTFILNAIGGRRMGTTVFEDDAEDGGTYMEFKGKGCSCVRKKSVRDSLLLGSDTYPEDIVSGFGDIN